MDSSISPDEVVASHAAMSTQSPASPNESEIALSNPTHAPELAQNDFHPLIKGSSDTDYFGQATGLAINALTGSYRESSKPLAPSPCSQSCPRRSTSKYGDVLSRSLGFSNLRRVATMQASRTKIRTLPLCSTRIQKLAIVNTWDILLDF